MARGLMPSCPPDALAAPVPLGPPARTNALQRGWGEEEEGKEQEEGKRG